MSYQSKGHNSEVYPIKDPDDPILNSLRQDIISQRRKTDLAASQNYIRLPLLGRLRCVKDRDGMLMLLSIFSYWVYGTWSSYYVILEPHYQDGHVSDLYLYYHFATAALCLIALIRSATMNPGALPTVDANFAAEHNWAACETCGRYRPQRAHHCRRCRQCVVRMDHHCPWINNCVGEGNHHVFSLLLFYAFLFSFNTFVVIMLHFWYWPKCLNCDREAFLIKHGIWFSYLSTLMSATMAFFMFMQFMTHHFNLILNRTTLDNMRPGDIENIDYSVLQIRSTCAAYREHCGTWKVYLWPWPCRRRKSSLMTNMVYA